MSIDDIEKAAKDSKRIKLIASASGDGEGRVKASVKPTLVADSDMLAHIGGVTKRAPNFNVYTARCDYPRPRSWRRLRRIRPAERHSDNPST